MKKQMKIKPGSKAKKKEALLSRNSQEKEIDIPFKNVIVTTSKTENVPKSEKSNHKKLIIALAFTIVVSFMLYFTVFFPVNRFINKAIQSTGSGLFQISSQEHNASILGNFSFYGIKIITTTKESLKITSSYLGGNISIWGLLNDLIKLETEMNGLKINHSDVSVQISLGKINLKAENIGSSRSNIEAKTDINLSQIKINYKKNISMLEKVPEITIPLLKFEGNLKNATLSFNPIRSNLLIKDENDKNINSGFIILDGKISILHDGFINIRGSFHPSEKFFQKYPFKEILIAQNLMDNAGNINFFIQGNMKKPTFRMKKENSSNNLND